MSYSINLLIDTGGEQCADLFTYWNYTSNCSPMWRAAGADLAQFHGSPAGSCLPILEAAIADMKANPAKYIAMNPENGWGSYETLVPALEALVEDFRTHPKAMVSVSR